MFTDLTWSQNLLIVLVDDYFEMERDLLDDLLVQSCQVVNPFVPVHEEVSHWILVVGLDALSHFLCEAREPHSDHEVIFDLEAGDRTVILADYRR